MLKSTYLIVATALLFASCEVEEPPVLSGADIAIEEGNTDFILTYEVSLNKPAPKDLTFDYKTVDLEAEAGTDFVQTEGTASIAKGQTTYSIEIPILTDEDWESDENFWIAYSNGNEVSIPDPFNVITIDNDDTDYNPSDSGYSTPLSYPGFNLVWQDEFDGMSLNTNDWNYETGNSGWGNQESQYYRAGSNNATVGDGYLTIAAKEENYGGAPFTSARITTQNKQSFKYGRIDIRARLPFGQGLWPALWMLGDNISTVGWPECGELDIMEMIGGEGYNDRTVHGTAHWNAGGQASHSGTTSVPTGEKLADEFHVYSLVWVQNTIRWLFDDVQYHSLNIGGLSAFHEPHFFIFNIAVEGDWPGPVGPNTTFPQYMSVDYVRVFQQ